MKLNIGAVVRRQTSEGPPLQGPWVGDVAPNPEILSHFSDWGRDITTILSHIHGSRRWAMHMVNPLDSYVRGGVVLIGDAVRSSSMSQCQYRHSSDGQAHAMVPHLSAGAGQGFEDCYVLFRLLTHPRTNVRNPKVQCPICRVTRPRGLIFAVEQPALEIYDDIRPKRAKQIQRESANMGRIYQGFGSEAGGNGVEETRERIRGKWEMVWNHDLEGEVAEHLEKLYGPEVRL